MEAAHRSGIVATLIAGLLAGCAAPSASPVPENPANTSRQMPIIVEASVAPPIEVAVPSEPQPPQPPAPPAPPVLALACGGPAKQGGAILCRALPGATITLDGKPVAIADPSGVVVIGLTRSQASPAKVAMLPVSTGEAQQSVVSASTEVEVLPRKDTVS